MNRQVSRFTFSVLFAFLSLVDSSQSRAQEYLKRYDKDNGGPLEKFLKSFTELIRITESKPVRASGAEFVAVAQADWKAPKSGPMSMVSPVDLQLRITNVGEKDLVFPTSKHFGLKLVGLDGQRVKSSKSGEPKGSTGAVVIPPATSFALGRRAELRWGATGEPELVFYDGSGTRTIFGPLSRGCYKLSFWCSVSPEETNEDIPNASRWKGEIDTGDVRVDLLEGTTRGRIESATRFGAVPQGVFRIEASKPVTENDAMFVAVAQSNWRIDNNATSTPIEIQLQITNLTNKARVFTTFDSFSLSILNSEGKRMLSSGGRDHTVLTGPILLPKKASYSICRKAELCWIRDPRGRGLMYWDGTGTVDVFGPLLPGKYHVRFSYGVAANPLIRELTRPQREKGDPEGWSGDCTIDSVRIQLQQ